ncbi:hypothetical protein BDFB_013784, partial [Asbolus verrucosus]
VYRETGNINEKKVQVDPKREHQKSLRKFGVLRRQLLQNRFGSYHRNDTILKNDLRDVSVQGQAYHKISYP